MTCFEKGHVNRDTIDLTLTAYNISCAEMRSEERDSYIRSNISRKPKSHHTLECNRVRFQVSVRCIIIEDHIILRRVCSTFDIIVVAPLGFQLPR